MKCERCEGSGVSYWWNREGRHSEVCSCVSGLDRPPERRCLGDDCCTAMRLCKLHDRAPALLEVLLEVEWSHGYMQTECPFCKEDREDGHKHDCKLGAALEGLR